MTQTLLIKINYTSRCLYRTYFLDEKQFHD